MDINAAEIEQQILKEEGVRIRLRFKRYQFILSYSEYIKVMRTSARIMTHSFQDRFNYFLDVSLSPRIVEKTVKTHGLYAIDDVAFDTGPFELVFESEDVCDLRKFYNENKNRFRECYFSHRIEGNQYFVPTVRHSHRSKS